MSRRRGGHKLTMDWAPKEKKSPGMYELQEHHEDATSGYLYVWVVLAVGLAGASYYFSGYLTSASTDNIAASVATVPESYAICGGNPGSIYTVDDTHPNVDCILVHKDEIRVTGTAGTRLRSLQNDISNVVVQITPPHIGTSIKTRSSRSSTAMNPRRKNRCQLST